MQRSPLPLTLIADMKQTSDVLCAGPFKTFVDGRLDADEQWNAEDKAQLEAGMAPEDIIVEIPVKGCRREVRGGRGGG